MGSRDQTLVRVSTLLTELYSHPSLKRFTLDDHIPQRTEMVFEIYSVLPNNLKEIEESFLLIAFSLVTYKSGEILFKGFFVIKKKSQQRNLEKTQFNLKMVRVF